MIFNMLVEDADLERGMTDSTIVRAHQQSLDAKEGKKIRR